MLLHFLYLHNFRAYQERRLTFGPRLNFIHGPNARGKTTILEAIHFLMTGRSFRTAQSKELMRTGTDSFYLEAGFSKYGVEQRLKITCQGKERKVIYNNTVCPSYTSLIGMLQGVVVTPDDVSLVKGAPGVRRHFLDVQIAQADPLYVHHITRYLRAMRQRNHLLRSKNVVTIESWEYEMANSAAYVTTQRRKAVVELQERAERFYCLFSGEKERLQLFYKSGAPKEKELKLYYLEQFARCRPKEMLLGFTFVGPHKDDLVFAIGDQDVKVYASEGQKRSVVVALKFAEWERLKSLADEVPLMLLDDVSMGLDDYRRQKLFDSLINLQQVFLTSTQKHNFVVPSHEINLAMSH